MKTRWKPTIFGKDGRRKHRHWQVKVFYSDGETFLRVYTDKKKAAKFAERQRKSPAVKMARVTQLS
jgi:hypothetical protein